LPSYESLISAAPAPARAGPDVQLAALRGQFDDVQIKRDRDLGEFNLPNETGWKKRYNRHDPKTSALVDKEQRQAKVRIADYNEAIAKIVTQMVGIRATSLDGIAHKVHVATAGTDFINPQGHPRWRMQLTEGAEPRSTHLVRSALADVLNIDAMARDRTMAMSEGGRKSGLVRSKPKPKRKKTVDINRFR
jgi:hypothetical protein